MNDNRTRMARAVSFIEKSLFDEDLSLTRIAREAGLSPYHFHRTFQTLAGEPVAEYVKKRRLDTAAELLAQTDRRILDIAVECGYASQEAFARAFSKAFGWPPGVFRRIKPPRKRYRRIDALGGEPSGFPPAPPRFETIERRRGYGLGKRITLSGYAGARSIMGLWKEFCRRTEAFPRVEELYGLGIYDLGEFLLDGDSFEYFACVHLDPCASVPEDFGEREIPGGLYAVFEYDGPPRRVRDAFNHIFGVWLPCAPYRMRTDPYGSIGFERYKTDETRGSVNRTMSIYVPVDPLE